MNELLGNIIDSLLLYVRSFFAEYTIMLLLVGLAFFLAGAFIISYQLYALMRGQIVDGTVIGAVRKVKITMVDRKVVKKRLKQGTLFPIFEYIDATGVVRQTKGSTGGSHVYKYRTGQRLKLIVFSRSGHQDVNDAGNYSGYILGIVFSGMGVGIVYCYTQIYASFNLSTLIWLSIIVSLFMKYKDRIQEIISDVKEHRASREKIFSLKRNFDPDDVRPIEDYVEEREQRRRKS